MPDIAQSISQTHIMRREVARIEDDDAAPWPDATGVGEVVYQPGSLYGPRTQQNVQLVLLHSGEMTVWVDDAPRHAAAESACLLLPGHRERFAFARDAPTHHSWMHARFTALPQAWHARLAALPWCLPLSLALADLMRGALALHAVSLPTRGLLLRAVAAQMLWQYLGEGELALRHTRAPAPPALDRARQFMREHAHAPLTLTTIAAAAAVSPTHLVRLFRAHLGITPMAWLWERRVDTGIGLLEQTGLTVGEIAERCGFQTSYHFSRRVRGRTGLPPVEVRQRLWR